LASWLAFLRCRLGGPKAFCWYGISLILFLLSVAGKLSVATFPAVLLALDLFVEHRPFFRSFPDKLPFVLAGGLIAVVVAMAQSPTGNRPDAYVLSAALLENLWLLSGFGSYVIYRVPP